MLGRSLAVPTAGATGRSIHPITLAMARRSSRGLSSRGTVVITTNNSAMSACVKVTAVCFLHP
jgi:hypothetical protein